MSNAENVMEALNWRYAVKKFDPSKKISERDWTVLEESLRLSASSFGLQPWKFIIITNDDLKKQLKPHSWGQTQIEDCSHLVVMTHLKKMDENYIDKHIRNVSLVRGMAPAQLEGYKQSMVGAIIDGPVGKVLEPWTARQTYIAMGTFLLTAAFLQVDTCPMEGIDPAKYDELLGLANTSYKTVAVIATGYRSADDNYQKLK